MERTHRDEVEGAERKPQVENLASISSFGPSHHPSMGPAICCWKHHSTSSSGHRHEGLRPPEGSRPERRPVGRRRYTQQRIAPVGTPAQRKAAELFSALGLVSNAKKTSYYVPPGMLNIKSPWERCSHLKIHFISLFYSNILLTRKCLFFNLKEIICFQFL